MSGVSRSFTVLASPQSVWSAASKLESWGDYLPLGEPKHAGWGRQWKLLAPAGPGARLEMLHEGALLQEWQVEAWEPPTRLRLASTAWHGHRQFSMNSSLEVRIAAVTGAETRVELELSASFASPLVATLTLIGGYLGGPSMDKTLRDALAHFERGIIAGIESGR